MKNEPNLYWIPLVHLKNPLNLFILKQKATKFYLILKLHNWSCPPGLSCCCCSKKQLYHSDDFKKQRETQKILCDSQISRNKLWSRVGQISPNKNRSPNPWHVTSILVCCIFVRSNNIHCIDFTKTVNLVVYVMKFSCEGYKID